MKCIKSPSDKCFFNIAGEEYYFDKFDEDVFFLYKNSPCIIIGKHQNAYAEINRDYARKNGIDVVRRNSGGGAVYHDLGNLNYGFITKNDQKSTNEIFVEFTRPILKVLNDLGVKAVFSGRNDLTIEGKKFSGNAQYRSKDKVLIHGTLLFSSDLEQLSKSLNVNPAKFEDKSVKSVRSRVTNILSYLPSPVTVDEFSTILVEEILSEFPSAYLYELSLEDQRHIQTLADNKYSTWEWNYGNSPEFNCRRTLKYELGLLDIGVQVESGLIKEIAIYGDFFAEKDLNEVLSPLKGVPFEKNAVSEALGGVNLAEYIIHLSNAALVNCIFE